MNREACLLTKWPKYVMSDQTTDRGSGKSTPREEAAGLYVFVIARWLRDDAVDLLGVRAVGLSGEGSGASEGQQKEGSGSVVP